MSYDFSIPYQWTQQIIKSDWHSIAGAKLMWQLLVINQLLKKKVTCDIFLK